MGNGVQASDVVGAARLAGLELTERDAESYAKVLSGLLAAARALAVPQAVEPAGTVAPPEVPRGR